MKNKAKKALKKAKEFKPTKMNMIAIGAAVVLLVVIVSIILVLDYNKKQDLKKKSTIDFSSETYKGKEIIVKDDRIIIKEENGSETIEVFKKDEDKMTKANKDIRSKFEIKNVSTERKVAKTLITGTVKAKSNDYKKAIVTANLYRNKVLIGSSSTPIDNLKKGAEREFEITFIGQFDDANSEVVIEYVK